MLGCGDSGGMSAQDQANLKAHDASKVHPPTGDMISKAKTIHTSLQDAATSNAPGAGGPPPGAMGAPK
jgi:hypothetical protein